MDFKSTFEILQARSHPNESQTLNHTGAAACPCCPDGSPICVFIDGSQPQESSTIQPCLAEDDGSLALLKNMETLELLNLFTALQGERVETYSSYNKAIVVLIEEGKVDEYPMLCAETTSIFSVLSRRIIEIKDILNERKLSSLATLINSVQEKEKEKLVLVAARHMDLLQNHIPSLMSLGMSLLPPRPEYIQAKITQIERDLSEIMDEVVACKCELL